MSDWTLGAVVDRGMALEAYCQTESCRKFFAFNLPTLIESVGAGFLVADIPEMDCEACGGRLDYRLALASPNDL